MRLRIFGIPKISLVILGFLPLIFWCVFHHATPLVIAGGIVLAAIFTVFFGRGFFGVRLGVFLAVGLVMAEAFISSMIDRDFFKLSEALILFAVGISLFFWLEKRVNSADLNPKLDWFEGEPKFLPQIKARVKVDADWQSGSVRTIDQNGFFVFLNDPNVKLPKTGVEFELQFKESEVQGVAKQNAKFSGHHSGFGLQFLPKDLYHFSQYTALVERLKGEGL